MPHEVEPMLATLVDRPFDREGWIFEPKWDGYRVIAEVDRRDVRLYSRNQKSFTGRFAPIAEALKSLGHRAVLDGEVVVLDAHGRSHFQLLQNYQRTGQGNLVYYVFDILFLDGKDLRSLPLVERKGILTNLLDDSGSIRFSEHIEHDGLTFHRAAQKLQLEGIMAKNGRSAYRDGIRTRDWLKIKTRQQQEAVIGGYTEPRGRRSHLGALILGVYEGDHLVYIGHTGGGFSEKSLAATYAKLKPLVRKRCPFADPPATNAPVHWVDPKLVCEVAFQEWTSDGILRQPIFLGFREDKSATEVVRERPRDTAEAVQKAEKRKSNRSA
jgi:bifunctional non-homologous end joining protein LigD